MKGLSVSVYRKPDGYDCTNGGISSKHDEFVLVGDGVDGPSEPREDAPAIRLIKRKVMGTAFWIAAPLDAEFEDGRAAGSPYKFGGNFLYTSDSRFPSDAPIKIFDRKE
jgi:hypothetical protein